MVDSGSTECVIVSKCTSIWFISDTDNVQIAKGIISGLVEKVETRARYRATLDFVHVDDRVPVFFGYRDVGRRMESNINDDVL